MRSSSSVICSRRATLTSFRTVVLRNWVVECQRVTLMCREWIWSRSNAGSPDCPLSCPPTPHPGVCRQARHPLLWRRFVLLMQSPSRHSQPCLAHCHPQRLSECPVSVGEDGSRVALLSLDCHRELQSLCTFNPAAQFLFNHPRSCHDSWPTNWKWRSTTSLQSCSSVCVSRGVRRGQQCMGSTLLSHLAQSTLVRGMLWIVFRGNMYETTK